MMLLLLGLGALAGADPLAFESASDAHCKAELSSDTLSWTGCRDSGQSGAAVSSSGFSCESAGDALPLRAVPGTALNNLILNGTFPGIEDPYLDDNLAKLPDLNVSTTRKSAHDANDSAAPPLTSTAPPLTRRIVLRAAGNFYTLWWRTSFSIAGDGKSCAGERLWLHLRGINYRARIFLNGEQLELPTEVSGMFQRFSFDATKLAKLGGAENVLAILVKPPDVVGWADQPVPGGAHPGGQGGDHGMAQMGPVMQYTEGWDWAVGVADRNTGPWDKIEMERSADIVIRHPHVATTSVTTNASAAGGEGAVVTASATLVNAGKESVTGELSFHFKSYDVHAQPVTKTVTIPGGGSIDVSLPAVAATRAALWWPQPLGHPHLHPVRLEFALSKEIVAAHELNIGLRTVEGIIEPSSGGRSFLINGLPIFLAGGNWIGTDQLLRYSTDATRYYSEVRMHKDMGMNLIRVWGGGLTERPEFYEAADQLGVLVMQEFWMTGDNNGRWAGDNDWPLDHSLYLSCAADVMKMLRNHPSLLFWCGGNELLPGTVGGHGKNAGARNRTASGWQGDLIENKLPTLVRQLDGHRFYIPSSMGVYSCVPPPL